MPQGLDFDLRFASGEHSSTRPKRDQVQAFKRSQETRTLVLFCMSSTIQIFNHRHWEQLIWFFRDRSAIQPLVRWWRSNWWTWMWGSYRWHIIIHKISFSEDLTAIKAEVLQNVMRSTIHYCPNFAAIDIWTSDLIVVEVCRTSFKKCSSDVQYKYPSNISCDFPWMISKDQTQQILMSILLVRRKLPDMDRIDRRTSPSDYKRTTLLICSVTQSTCEWYFDFRFVLMGSWTYGDVSKSCYVNEGLPKDFALKTTNFMTIVSQWTSRCRYGRPGSRWITQSQRRVIGSVVQGVVQRMLINSCQELNMSVFESQSCIILALHSLSLTHTHYTPVLCSISESNHCSLSHILFK